MTSAQPFLSIIVPVLNEAQGLTECLQCLQVYRQQGCELIVVDGGSEDQSLAIAAPLADQVLVAATGRALQMNAGAAVASGEYLLFLHSDTQLPGVKFIKQLESRRPAWGYFAVKLSEADALLSVVAMMMNWRSKLTRVATGDQCLFVKRALIQDQPFAEIPLMEDVAFSKTMRRLSPPMMLKDPVLSSSRRWRSHGVLKTIVSMWCLRLAYVVGVSPVILHRWYYGAKL